MDTSNSGTPPIPLCLLCGDLGAGKSTVLRSLLSSFPSRAPQTLVGAGNPEQEIDEPWATALTLTIINDYSSTSIDAFVFQNSAARDEAADSNSPFQKVEQELVQQAEFQRQLERVRDPPLRGDGAKENVTVELAGGCVCCNLLASLVKLLEAAHEYNTVQFHLAMTAGEERRSSFRYSYVFLECTGVGESLPIVTALLHFPQLKQKVMVDAVLTVVDSRSLFQAAPSEEMPWEQPLEALQPFLRLRAGLTAETLKGSNVLVINAWEDALMMELQRMRVSEKAGLTNANEVLPRLQGHLQGLVSALRDFSEIETQKVVGPKGGSVGGDVMVCWTSKGDLSDHFFSNIYKKKLFEKRYLLCTTDGKESLLDYFTEAYGAKRVRALREGRIIALRKKRPSSEAEESESEEEVMMAEEEARERAKLGMHSWTLEIAEADAGAIPLRISHLTQALRSTQGRALLRNVWRSKGFFYAVDDERPIGDHVPAASTASEKWTQFRWQTVGKHVHYGEVLPPHVSLFSAEKKHSDPLRVLLVFMGAFDVQDLQWQEGLKTLFTRAVGQ